MSTDEYVPSEDLIIEAWKRYSGAQDARYARLSDGDAGDEARRVLARVRRDAAGEAWTDCVSEASALGWLHPPAALDMLDRNPHEETP